jgi:hypothetical protein
MSWQLTEFLNAEAGGAYSCYDCKALGGGGGGISDRNREMEGDKFSKEDGCVEEKEEKRIYKNLRKGG